MEIRHVPQTSTTDSEDSIVHTEPTCDALSTKLYTASFVKINGITYRPKDVLALHFDEYGDPVFFEISNIFFSS